MFEKEAEKYAEKHAFRIPYDGSNNFYEDKDYECSKEGFQKCAEFGYNKSNEWHFVKDKDLPKDTDSLYYVLVYSWDFGLSHLYKKKKIWILYSNSM